MGLFDKFCPLIQKTCIEDKCKFWTHNCGEGGFTSMDDCAIVLIARFV